MIKETLILTEPQPLLMQLIYEDTDFLEIIIIPFSYN